MPKYTDRLIYMEGIIVEVHDGAVGISNIQKHKGL